MAVVGSSDCRSPPQPNNMFPYKTEGIFVGVTFWSVKCLLHKHEDQSSIPEPHKNPNCGGICNPSLGMVETEGSPGLAGQQPSCINEA